MHEFKSVCGKLDYTRPILKYREVGEAVVPGDFYCSRAVIGENIVLCDDGEKCQPYQDSKRVIENGKKR